MAPEANLTTQSINRFYNEGTTATLVCTSFGGPNNTYQWQGNGTNLGGQNSDTLALPNVSASTGGIYTCIVSNIAGSDSINTSVFVAPYFVNQPLDQQVSVGSPLLIICDVEAFPNPDYLWERVDGRSIRNGIATDGRILNISTVNFGDEGEYYCKSSEIQSRNVLVTGKL